MSSLRSLLSSPDLTSRFHTSQPHFPKLRADQPDAVAPPARPHSALSPRRLVSFSAARDARFTPPLSSIFQTNPVPFPDTPPQPWRRSYPAARHAFLLRIPVSPFNRVHRRPISICHPNPLPLNTIYNPMSTPAAESINLPTTPATPANPRYPNEPSPTSGHSAIPATRQILAPLLGPLAARPAKARDGAHLLARPTAPHPSAPLLPAAILVSFCSALFSAPRMTHKISLIINGQPYSAEVEPRLLLIHRASERP
jgi:hypothetical protein